MPHLELLGGPQGQILLIKFLMPEGCSLSIASKFFSVPNTGMEGTDHVWLCLLLDSASATRWLAPSKKCQGLC